MRSDGVPVESDAKMVEWFAALPTRSQQLLSASFRDKIFEAQAKLSGDGPPDPDSKSADELAEFEATYKPSADETDNLAQQKKIREFYHFRWTRAQARRDRAGEAEALKHYARLTDLIHDAELRAARLGRDLGESFSAEDVRRLGRAIGFWLAAGADTLISQAASGLTAALAVGPLDRESVRRIIEPLILTERVAAPMQRATEINAGVALPPIFVEAMQAGLAMVVEEDPSAAVVAESTPTETPCAESPR